MAKKQRKQDQKRKRRQEQLRQKKHAQRQERATQHAELISEPDLRPTSSEADFLPSVAELRELDRRLHPDGDQTVLAPLPAMTFVTLPDPSQAAQRLDPLAVPDQDQPWLQRERRAILAHAEAIGSILGGANWQERYRSLLELNQRARGYECLLRARSTAMPRAADWLALCLELQPDLPVAKLCHAQLGGQITFAEQIGELWDEEEARIQDDPAMRPYLTDWSRHPRTRFALYLAQDLLCAMCLEYQAEDAIQFLNYLREWAPTDPLHLRCYGAFACLLCDNTEQVQAWLQIWPEDANLLATNHMLNLQQWNADKRQESARQIVRGKQSWLEALRQPKLTHVGKHTCLDPQEVFLSTLPQLHPARYQAFVDDIDQVIERDREVERTPPPRRRTRKSTAQPSIKLKRKKASLNSDGYRCTVPPPDAPPTAACILEGENLQALQPWKWIPADQVLQLAHPRSGETWYVDIIGQNGEQCGIIFYVGEAGWRSRCRMYQNEGPDDGSIAMFVDGYALLFTDRQVLNPDWYQQLRKFSVQYRGAGNWVEWTRMRPGHWPACPDEQELADCAAAAGLLRDSMLAMAKNVPLKIITGLIHRDGEEGIRVDADVRLPTEEATVAAAFDEIQARRIRQLPSEDTWQIGWTLGPRLREAQGVINHLVLALDAAGLIIAQDVTIGVMEADQLIRFIAAACEKCERRPERIAITHSDYIPALAAWSQATAIPIHSPAPTVAYVLEELSQQLR